MLFYAHFANSANSRGRYAERRDYDHDGGGVDLTSPAGKMTMAMIAAVAEFERDLLVQRTQAGLSRAKSKRVS